MTNLNNIIQVSPPGPPADGGAPDNRKLNLPVRPRSPAPGHRADSGPRRLSPRLNHGLRGGGPVRAQWRRRTRASELSPSGTGGIVEPVINFPAAAPRQVQFLPTTTVTYATEIMYSVTVASLVTEALAFLILVLMIMIISLAISRLRVQIIPGTQAGISNPSPRLRLVLTGTVIMIISLALNQPALNHTSTGLVRSSCGLG